MKLTQQIVRSEYELDTLEVFIMLRAYFEILMSDGIIDAKLPVTMQTLPGLEDSEYRVAVIDVVYDNETALWIDCTTELYEFIERLENDAEVRYHVIDALVDIYYALGTDLNLSELLKMIELFPELRRDEIIKKYQETKL